MLNGIVWKIINVLIGVFAIYGSYLLVCEVMEWLK